MNIWTWILFYIYSGVALAGICAGTTSSFTSKPYNPENKPEIEEEHQKYLQALRDTIVVQAQELGNQMANATTLSLVGGYNSNIINLYEQNKQREAEQEKVLHLVPPAVVKGN